MSFAGLEFSLRAGRLARALDSLVRVSRRVEAPSPDTLGYPTALPERSAAGQPGLDGEIPLDVRLGIIPSGMPPRELAVRDRA